MNIVAIDDEMPALSTILDALSQVRPDATIKGFSDPDELIEYAKDNQIDIACLDIQIYDITGIDLAASLKEVQPKINIIFVTAFGDYITEAMNLHASGYLRKPVSVEELEKELSDLRYEIKDNNPVKMKVKCFGNFEVFDSQGEIVKFSRAKSKEALAYLIILNGSSCTINEIAGILFEDEPYDAKKKMYIQKILSAMQKDLENANMAEVLRKSYNNIAINPSLIECDYYNYLNGNKEGNNAFYGEFFNQYSWAEYYCNL